MNKREIEEYFARLGELMSRFIVHDAFVQEIRELLDNDVRGKESQFFQLLVYQLGNLLEYGWQISSIDSHEHLMRTGGPYYSIHMQRKEFNIRMLVRIDSDHTYLLCIFYERSGKGTTNYSSHVPIMQKRYDELKEG